MSKSKSAQDKKPQKTFLGMPMQWDFKNWNKDLWNSESDVLFPPKRFGIGWGCNFHAVFRKIGIIKKKN
jgi:hypothetical protein